MVSGEISEAQLDMPEFIQFIFNFILLAQNLPLKETILKIFLHSVIAQCAKINNLCFEKNCIKWCFYQMVLHIEMSGLNPSIH